MNVLMVTGMATEPKFYPETEDRGPALRFQVLDRIYNRRRKDYTNQWVPCMLLGQRSVAVNKYLQKGMIVSVHGQLTLRYYKGEDGKRKTFPLLYVKDIMWRSTSHEHVVREKPVHDEGIVPYEAELVVNSRHDHADKWKEGL